MFALGVVDKIVNQVESRPAVDAVANRNSWYKGALHLDMKIAKVARPLCCSSEGDILASVGAESCCRKQCDFPTDCPVS